METHTKPWTRWWWMGNSVTKDGITQHLEAFKEADLGGVPWKNYYDINFVDIRYQAFDASIWVPMPSGLLGPVTLIPVDFD